MTPITKPGIYDIPAPEYHADPCPTPSLSSSVARILIERSPAHAWQVHVRLNPNYIPLEANTAMNIGSAVHAVVLDGDMSGIVFINAESWRTKEAKENREWALSEGKIPLLAKHQMQIVDMKAAIWSHIPKGAQCEKTLVWEEHGAWFRARPDMIPGRA